MMNVIGHNSWEAREAGDDPCQICGLDQSPIGETDGCKLCNNKDKAADFFRYSIKEEAQRIKDKYRAEDLEEEIAREEQYLREHIHDKLLLIRMLKEQLSRVKATSFYCEVYLKREKYGWNKRVQYYVGVRHKPQVPGVTEDQLYRWTYVTDAQRFDGHEHLQEAEKLAIRLSEKYKNPPWDNIPIIREGFKGKGAK